MLVFDLDSTLWEYSRSCELVEDAPAILLAAHAVGIKLGVASLNGNPSGASQYLDQTLISTDSNRPDHISVTGRRNDPKSIPIQKGETQVLRLFEMGAVVIKPKTGTKKWHFDKLQRDVRKQSQGKTTIDFRDMLFFDDLEANRDVEQIGVTMQQVDKRQGVTKADLVNGIKRWRKRRQG